MKKRASTRLPAHKRGARLYPNEEEQPVSIVVEQPVSTIVEDVPEPSVVEDIPATPIRNRGFKNQWSTRDIAGALHDVEENGMSTRAAAKKWKIPAITLNNWLGGITSTSKKGPQNRGRGADSGMVQRDGCNWSRP